MTKYPGVEAHFGIVYRQTSEATKQHQLPLEDKQIVFSEYRPTKASSLSGPVKGPAPDGAIDWPGLDRLSRAKNP